MSVIGGCPHMSGCVFKCTCGGSTYAGGHLFMWWCVPLCMPSSVQTCVCTCVCVSRGRCALCLHVCVCVCVCTIGQGTDTRSIDQDFMSLGTESREQAPAPLTSLRFAGGPSS